eukprot:3112038-Amphidinium_carterae.1
MPMGRDWWQRRAMSSMLRAWNVRTVPHACLVVNVTREHQAGAEGTHEHKLFDQTLQKTKEYLDSAFQFDIPYVKLGKTVGCLMLSSHSLREENNVYQDYSGHNKSFGSIKGKTIGRHRVQNRRAPKFLADPIQFKPALLVKPILVILPI